MITKKTKTDDPEQVEAETVTDPEPPVEPVEDCGCSKHGDARLVRMRHPNLNQMIEVNPISVPNWEKTGWETIE